jgi:ribosomal protein L37AE/L43A
MENIVRLAEYRSRRKAARARHPNLAPDLGAQYFCTRCDSDEFKLAAAGMVHCAHCGALMRNLLVGTPEPDDGGSAA